LISSRVNEAKKIEYRMAKSDPEYIRHSIFEIRCSAPEKARTRHDSRESASMVPSRIAHMTGAHRFLAGASSGGEIREPPTMECTGERRKRRKSYTLPAFSVAQNEDLGKNGRESRQVIKKQIHPSLTTSQIRKEL
jgi:hypothetical protein